MGMSISGLASGIDSDSIIAQLLALEEQRIFMIQKRIAEEEVKKAAYSDLSGRVQALRSIGTSLSSPTVYGKLDGSSTDGGMSVTLNSKASEGSYQVEVLQTATKHRIAGQGFKDQDSTPVAPGGGSFVYNLGGGTSKTIELEATTTLKEFVEKINDAGLVNASIVNDGSELNPYRVVLTSKASGTKNQIVIEQNDTTLNFSDKQIEAATTGPGNSSDYAGTITSGGTYTGDENTTFVIEMMSDGAADGTAKYRLSTDGGLTFSDNGGVGYSATSGGPIDLGHGVTISFEDNGTLREGDTFSIDVFNPELESGSDAILKVDGISIKKSSNRISDVFEGITFDIESATVGKVSKIDVTRDSGTVTEKLAEFVGAYNSVVGFLSSQFKFDPASNTAAPPLNGDSAARQVDRQVKGLIAKRMNGLGAGVPATLTELGLESNRETGLLSFNPMKLEEVADKDPKAVERILSSFGERLSGNFEFVSRSNATKPGEYDVVVTQARTGAEVAGTLAADALAQNETLTFNFSRDAQDESPVFRPLDVELLAGETAQQQIEKINTAFEDKGFELESYLDDFGVIQIRTTELGSDYAFNVISDQAAGAGTSGIGNVELSSQGTDLAGKIGGIEATVFQGTQLRAANGYDVEGIRVEIPDGVSGSLGKVRIVDGLASILPDIVDSLTGPKGVIGTRTSGVDKRIESLNEDIIKQQERMSRTEERLRRQFTAMEVTMAQLNSLGDYITQQMDAMAAANKKK